MIRSMTGFGQCTSQLGGLRLVAELRSVNSRYADLRFRMPAELAPLEGEFRRRIAARVRRGRVEVTVRIERPSDIEGVPVFNESLFGELLEASKRLSRDFGIVGRLDVASVLSMPGMFKSDSQEMEWGEAERDNLYRTLDGALEELDADRLREGSAIQRDLLDRLSPMADGTGEIRRLAERMPAIVRDKLLQRIEALAGDVELDPARIAQEAAHLADRCDVTEEIVRLEGHLAQAAAILEADEDRAVGKRLEFIVQEILRETNTICSKSSDLELTRGALELRAEVEKVREQVQNLE
jgi:uncharacterized protein (TIGR00255 family)